MINIDNPVGLALDSSRAQVEQPLENGMIQQVVERCDQRQHGKARDSGREVDQRSPHASHDDPDILNAVIGEGFLRSWLAMAYQTLTIAVATARPSSR